MKGLITLFAMVTVVVLVCWMFTVVMGIQDPWSTPPGSAWDSR